MTVDPLAARLAAVLGEVLPRLRRLAAEIEQSWPDRGGREWAWRVALVQGELGRLEVAAAELAARWTSGGGRRPPAAPGPDGPRVAGIEGQRVDDGSGVRIAELPPP